MENFVILFLLLGSFVAAIAFIVGLFSPQTVKCQTRGKVALVYPTLSLGILIIAVSLVPPSEHHEESYPLTSEQESILEDVKKELKLQEESQSESFKESLKKHSSKQTKSNQEVESSIGKAIQIGHFVYTVQGVSFRKSVGDEFSEEIADGIYMLVNVSIKNISKETHILDGSLFAVTDKEGTKYEFSREVSTALEMSGKKTLFLKECQPNITTKGLLVFEVPQKGEYYLHLIGNFWGEQSVKVLLR